MHRKIGTFIWNSKLQLKLQIETFNIKMNLAIYKARLMYFDYNNRNEWNKKMNHVKALWLSLSR